MADEKDKLAEKTERQADQLKKSNPDANVEVENEKDGAVQVSTVKVSTEKKV